MGSCYIGDIMEQYETHRALFTLPRYVFPIWLLCFGYPTRQIDRPQTSRFDEKFILFENRYRRLDRGVRADVPRQESLRAKNAGPGTASNMEQVMYRRKFGADFSLK